MTWYQREQALLSTLRAKHPQVKALIARLDESERDLALQFSLTGRAPEGVRMMRSLMQRRAMTEVSNEDDARFAMVQARVLLLPTGLKVPAAERGDLLSTAENGVRVVRAAAAKEPFNALLAREAALSAYWLGELIGSSDAARACTLRQEAASELR